MLYGSKKHQEEIYLAGMKKGYELFKKTAKEGFKLADQAAKDLVIDKFKSFITRKGVALAREIVLNCKPEGWPQKYIPGGTNEKRRKSK